MTSWSDPLRPEVLEAVLAETAQRRRRAAGSSADERRRRLREEDLAAVAGGRDPGRAVDVGADVVAVGDRAGRRPYGCPSGRGRARRPATARRRAPAGASTAARDGLRGARRRRRRTTSPSVALSSPPCGRERRSGSARGGAPAAPPSGRRPSAWASGVEPSMSVNRKVTVPVGSVGVGGHRSRSVVSGGAARSRRGAAADSPRRIAERERRLRRGRRLEVPGREREAARRLDRRRPVAMRGRPSSTDSSPKKSPGPRHGQLLAVADDPDRARRR